MAIQRVLLDCFAALAMTVMLLFATPAAAQTFPALTGRVVDQADLLRPEQEVDLTGKLAALETQSGRQFVVATVKSLDGYEISDYSTKLGRAWKIGDEQRDDGVVMVVAPKERKVWIATGYGADDVLTDAFTGLIIRGTVLPKFKAGDMGGGIIAGADAVIQQLSLPPEEARKRAAEIAAKQKQREVEVNPIPVGFIVIIFFVIIGSIARRAGGKRYRRRGGGIDPWVVIWGLNELSKASRGGGSSWGGGGGGGWGGGGGGFSGGGGSFGGGGAGGSW